MSGRVGSLCTGYGGLEQALAELFDIDLAWVSDIDKGANKILAHRYPHTPNLGDFTTVDWRQVEPVDIFTAGFPCQPVSHAGKRAGTDDERWLFDDITSAVGLLDPRPGLLVFENVLGLLSANRGHAMARVVHGLAQIGYVGSWRTLRASDVGAPHRRERVFIVAHPGGPGRGTARGSEWRAATGAGPSSGLARGDSRALLPTPRATDPAGEMSRSSDGFRPQLGEVARLLPTPAVNDMGEGKTVDASDEWTDAMQAKHGNGNGHGKSLAIEAQRLLPTPSAQLQHDSQTHRSGARTDELLLGGLALDLGTRQTWGDYAPAIARWETVLGRPAPAPTETGPKGSPRLSPRFVEWMMGLPQGWVTDVPGLTRNEQLKALGNGVVPQQAAAAVGWLLGGEPLPRQPGVARMFDTPDTAPEAPNSGSNRKSQPAGLGNQIRELTGGVA